MSFHLLKKKVISNLMDACSYKTEHMYICVSIKHSNPPDGIERVALLEGRVWQLSQVCQLSVGAADDELMGLHFGHVASADWARKELSLSY